jgi:hypothetical protein
MTDIEQAARDLAEVEATLKMLYQTRDELRFAIWSAIKEEYPDDWSRVVEKRQANSFTVGSVTIEMPSREYDPALLARVLTEDEYATVHSEEVVVKQKIDGRKMAAFWKDVSRVEALQTAVIPGVPRVKVK